MCITTKSYQKNRNSHHRFSEERNESRSFVNTSHQRANFLCQEFGLLEDEMWAMYRIKFAGLVAELKEKLFWNFRDDSRWRTPGLQLPLPYPLASKTLLQKMVEQKNNLILREVSEFIFRDKVNYIGVYLALKEFLREAHLEKDFDCCVNNPYALLLRCAIEQAKLGGQPFPLELILSLTNNE